MDSKVFPEPETLKPERFLDSDGQLCRNDQWIPFSMGKSIKNTIKLCFAESFRTMVRHKMYTIVVMTNWFPSQ